MVYPQKKISDEDFSLIDGLTNNMLKWQYELIFVKSQNTEHSESKELDVVFTTPSPSQLVEMLNQKEKNIHALDKIYQTYSKEINNQQNHSGQTAIQIALDKDYYYVVCYLLSRGIRIDMVDNQINTILTSLANKEVTEETIEVFEFIGALLINNKLNCQSLSPGAFSTLCYMFNNFFDKHVLSQASKKNL